jgi:hypothetical protein
MSEAREAQDAQFNATEGTQRAARELLGEDDQVSGGDIAFLGRYAQLPESSHWEAEASFPDEAKRAKETLARYVDALPEELVSLVVSVAGQPEADVLGGDFDFQRGIETLLKAQSPAPETQDGRLSAEYMEARKNFVVAVANRFRDEQASAQTESEMETLRQLAGRTEGLLFSGSPNMVDYVGGFDDMIDVATAAQDAPLLKRLNWESKESLMQAITFTGEPDGVVSYFTDKVEAADPVSKLQILKLGDQLARQAMDTGSYGDNAAQLLYRVFEAAEQDGTALASLAAGYYRSNLETLFQDDMQVVGDSATELVWQERYGLTPAYQLPENLKDYYTVSHVASDAVGLRDSWGTIKLADTKTDTITANDDISVLARLGEVMRMRGVTAELVGDSIRWAAANLSEGEARDKIAGMRDPAQVAAFAQEQLHGAFPQPVEIVPEPLRNKLEGLQVPGGDVDYTVRLIQELHLPSMREMVEDTLGVGLSAVDLQSQVFLLDFMAKADHKAFDRLSAVMHEKPGLGPEFLESFLALEHGEEFGMGLLSIAEHSTPEQARQVAEFVQQFREAGKDFAGIFAGEGEGFGGQVEWAVQERLVELLSVTEEVARQGSFEMDIVGDRSVEIRDLDQLLKDFAVLAGAMQDLTETMHDSTSRRVTAEGVPFDMYRFEPNKDGGKSVLLYARPEGAYGYDKDIEYGNNRGVEASVSFMIDPVSQQPLSVYKHGRSNALSIRFDREGRLPDESAQSAERDPTREDGLMSIDIGAVLGDGDDFGVRIGRIIAAGNILHSRNQGRSESLNHSHEYFNQAKYGQASGFREFAHRMRFQAESRLSQGRSRAA